jgi:hypothetical protein
MLSIYANLDGVDTYLFNIELTVLDPCSWTIIHEPVGITNITELYEVTIPQPGDTSTDSYNIDECPKSIYCIDRRGLEVDPERYEEGVLYLESYGNHICYFGLTDYPEIVSSVFDFFVPQHVIFTDRIVSV